MCKNPNCTHPHYERVIKPAFRPLDDIRTALGLTLTTHDEVVLCPSCYHDVYLHFQEATNCHSCGAISKSGNKFCRHSPDAQRVSQHLKESTGCEIALNPDDYICLNCYKLHCSIIKTLDSALEGTDTMLKCMTETWKAQANETNSDIVMVAVLRTVILVADYLLQEKALLLPQACLIFFNAYGINHPSSITSLQLDLDVGESTVKFSSRWLLNQLIIHLNPYMSYKCIHMRIGTILFRKGGSILKSLSYALSMASQSPPTIIEENQR